MTTTLPRLDAALVQGGALAHRPGLVPPDPALLALPVRAVQWGTGALLRGLVDVAIDDANLRGAFGGRIVAIGSTGSGRDQAINDQDGLFTLVMQGIADGRPVRERRVVSAVSHALSAVDAWPEVLRLARDPLLEVVFSNTTEVGIRMEREDAPSPTRAPRSFPAKLAQFLHERARHFGFAREKGVMVIPCELIEDNGERLKALVLEHGARWGLGDAFARWIAEAVTFCNTLVDRIVPGAPQGEHAAALRDALGYDDALATTCEPYHLLAIEGDDRLRARLRFAAAPGAETGVVVTSDVAPFRLRKVRLLNGGHTIMVPLALLAGCTTVREAVEHELVGPFLRRAMFEELVPALQVPGAEAFARRVLDRFANPCIHHQLVDITLHGTAKMRVRVVPSVVAHVARTGTAPQALAFGFAAWLAFMAGDVHAARRAQGQPMPDDSEGARVRDAWSGVGDNDPAALGALVHASCADVELWGTDLAALPGFEAAVREALVAIRRDGATAALEAMLGAWTGAATAGAGGATVTEAR